MNPKLYILSIDGGGLKGLIAIRILKIIEKITGKSITQQFNLLGGTSTGGLIVSALTVKDRHKKPLYDLDHVESMYLEAGQTVLQQGGFNFTGSETEHLNHLLDKTFGDIKIADTLLPVFIPTYDLNENRIIIFKTRSARQDDSKNIRLFDVCRATSAIPPVFPTYPVKYHHRELRCVDGGYYMRNPAMAVLAEAWKHRAYYAHAELREEDIVLLSVSTGNFKRTKKDWSSNIHESMSDHSIARNYIKEQGLKINLDRINYMRVDLNLGSGSFDLMKLIAIGERLEALSADQEFHTEITVLLGK
jgi:hypothetical protein